MLFESAAVLRFLKVTEKALHLAPANIFFLTSYFMKWRWLCDTLLQELSVHTCSAINYYSFGNTIFSFLPTSWNIIKMNPITITMAAPYSRFGLHWLRHGTSLKWTNASHYSGTIFDDWIALATSWDIIKMEPITIPEDIIQLETGCRGADGVTLKKAARIMSKPRTNHGSAIGYTSHSWEALELECRGDNGRTLTITAKIVSKAYEWLKLYNYYLYIYILSSRFRLFSVELVKVHRLEICFKTFSRLLSIWASRMFSNRVHSW